MVYADFSVWEKKLCLEGKMDVEKRIFEKIIEYERERLSPMAAENRKIRGGNIKKRNKLQMTLTQDFHGLGKLWNGKVG